MAMTVSGKVSVHEEAALGATVELHNSSGDIVTQSQVDDDGRYMFHLAPGDWSLNAWDAHGHRGTATFSLQEGDHKTVDLVLDEPHGGH